ncbi:MAG: helix-turn-helix transcriptional regulator [Archangium sp.]|nr:helix-turn-helix transcriptional regulator [Archangium sp.]
MSDKMDRKRLLTELGTRFRALREELKWTQQRLSARAGVSRDTIHRLERGEVVDASSLTRLLDAMGQRLVFEKKPALRAADVRRMFAEVHEDADL